VSISKTVAKNYNKRIANTAPAQEGQDLPRYADMALYRAKESKKSVCMYNPDKRILDHSMISEANTD
jgi:hypothetical protein